MYISAVAIDDLEGLLNAETEDGLHTGSIVVDSYTYKNTATNDRPVDEFVVAVLVVFRQPL